MGFKSYWQEFLGENIFLWRTSTSFQLAWLLVTLSKMENSYLPTKLKKKSPLFWEWEKSIFCMRTAVNVCLISMSAKEAKEKATLWTSFVLSSGLTVPYHVGLYPWKMCYQGPAWPVRVHGAFWPSFSSLQFSPSDLSV